MSKADDIRVSGTIVEAFPNNIFNVKIQNDHIVQCVISGKLRLNNIRLTVGDSVEITMTPYDLNRGRIIWRNK